MLIHHYIKCIINFTLFDRLIEENRTTIIDKTMVDSGRFGVFRLVCNNIGFAIRISQGLDTQIVHRQYFLYCD